MRKQIQSVFVAAATLLLASVDVEAATKRETIRLDRAVSVGGSVLEAGTYKVEIAPDLDTVSFVQGKRVVASVPCTVGVTRVVYPGNAIHSRVDESGRDRIVKIVLADPELAIDFATEAPVGASHPIATAAERP